MAMMSGRLLSKKLPVLYRWLRRRHYFKSAVLLCCVVFFLPVGIIGGTHISHFIAANQALAATRAMAPEHTVLEQMSEKERGYYAVALKGLVTEDPDRFHQLIDQDILALFAKPDLERREGASVSWQYQEGECILDLYFQNDGQGGQGPVIHYEIRQRKVAALSGQRAHEGAANSAQCLEDIYRRKET